MTLFRTSDIIMVLLMLCTAFWTYEIKYEAQKRYQEVRSLERKIEIEQDTAALLRARWALATEPARLQRLAEHYHDALQLQLIEPRQIVTLEAVPPRLPDAIEIAIRDSEAIIGKNAVPQGKTRADNLDMTATGSVPPTGRNKADKTARQRKEATAETAKIGAEYKNQLSRPPYIIPGKAAAPGTGQPVAGGGRTTENAPEAAGGKAL
ncbi:cell division protein FtsL [Candidatus Tokpelaia sp.]|uniref:cell division protein FtsL n=1 Tax=Candidatus Tokpelaia sp. TaxID=2233777 RepID=UPI001680B7EE|nr:hypothetical protein [Candidatus Tokpelaia sp.]